MATKNANGASIWEIAHSAKRPLLGPEAVLRGSTPSTDTSTFCQRTIGKLRQQRVALMTAGRDGIAASSPTMREVAIPLPVRAT